MISLYISSKGISSSILVLVCASTLTPFQLTQNAAALFVFSLHKFSNITSLLSALHWHPVAAHLQFKVLLLAYKATKGTAPPMSPDHDSTPQSHTQQLLLHCPSLLCGKLAIALTCPDSSTPPQVGLLLSSGIPVEK